MIDTVKIYCPISDKIYNKIHFFSNIKTMFNRSSGEIFYEITSDSLEGSYSSKLSVRLVSALKYGLHEYRGSKWVIEIEGSYHKLMKGQNAFDGFYSLSVVAGNLIKMVEEFYHIRLPVFTEWFLQRVDISKCFDLYLQENVCKYINSLSLLAYPRRNRKFYENESLYFSGTTTTLKIYNKFMEFEKHDRAKVSKFIDTFDIEDKIKGYVRFECEIKKKKLSDFYRKDNIRVFEVKYKDLEKIWSDEFMKILKYDDIKFEHIRKKEDVKERLNTLYRPVLATKLYQFFITILNDGYNVVKEETSSSTFYRNIKYLKNAGIDFSQSSFEDIIVINTDNVLDFDPFTCKEVA